jgi:ABC-2 type transport system permease protein
MFDVLAAEHAKLARHKAAWGLVWIFPIGLLLVMGSFALWEVARPAVDLGPPDTAAEWVRESTFVWGGPSSEIGRYLLAAFAAFAFGGEYGWNTWKLITPHRPRAMLIAAKFTVVVGLIATALVLTAVIGTGGGALLDPIVGDGVPAGVRLVDVLRAHAAAGASAAVVVLLSIAYAAAAAIITRSTLAAAVIAIVLISIESLTRLLLAVKPAFYHWSPGHHVANLRRWITDGEAMQIPLPEAPIADPWQVSLLYVALFLAAVVALTFAVFQRQDLN